MADIEAAPPVFKKRGAKANLRKRPATPPPASSSDSSSEDESGQRVKRRKKTAVVTASSEAPKHTVDFSTTKFAGDRSTTITEVNDATKQSNWYDEAAPDALSAKNLLGKTREKPQMDVAKGANEAHDGTYKGQAGYQSYIQKNPDSLRKIGPVKASTNVRSITVTDFAPDVCKDYKQTGFCGFGDSCKFLHAREDYKQGWQLDKDWEISGGGKKASSGGTIVSSANRKKGEEGLEDAEAKELEKIPFKCIICKEDYRTPVVTKCGHYFCEACALKRYRKNPSCAACGEDTRGAFGTAKRLRDLLEKKRVREEKMKEAAEGEKA